MGVRVDSGPHTEPWRTQLPPPGPGRSEGASFGGGQRCVQGSVQSPRMGHWHWPVLTKGIPRAQAEGLLMPCALPFSGSCPSCGVPSGPDREKVPAGVRRGSQRWWGAGGVGECLVSASISAQTVHGHNKVRGPSSPSFRLQSKTRVKETREKRRCREEAEAFLRALP